MYVIVTNNEKELLEIARRKGFKVLEIDKEDFDAPKLSKVNDIAYSNVSEFLLALGVRPHIKGFDYLEYILEKNRSYNASITKALYPTVAKVFNTTASRVERAIRHAIETAITNTDTAELYCKLFGNFKSYPTNSQFIKGCKTYLKNNPII